MTRRVPETTKPVCVQPLNRPIDRKFVGHAMTRENALQAAGLTEDQIAGCRLARVSGLMVWLITLKAEGLYSRK